MIDPIQPKEDLIEKFCLCIKEYEGWTPPNPKLPKGSAAFRRNNPGNIRCLLGDTANWNHLATRSENNFCIFPDYETGWRALYEKITNACTGKSKVYHPDMTILDFFKKYEQGEDEGGKVSLAYGTWMAQHMNLPLNTKIKEFIV